MPCGVGAVPTGAGLVDGGVDQGPWLQERVGGGVGAMAVLGWLFQRGASPGKGSGKGWLGGRGGCKGFGCGGVGGRGGANFATCVVFLSFLTRTKRRKMAFFEGCPVGWRGGTHRSWPGGRGGRPRALVAGEGSGGRRGDGSSKEGGGLGLGWLFQRGASPQPSENRGE